MSTITRRDNHITVEGDLITHDLHRLLATHYAAVEKARYDEIIVDFSCCSAAFPSAMLGVCAQLAAYREGGVEITLVPPNAKKLSRLFVNSNWAHLIDPRSFDRSTYRGHTHVPATNYRNPDEQFRSVNLIVNAILGAVPELDRRDFAAFEWSINEITDNVLMHAQSPIGGLVQVSTFQRNKKIVQYVVADAGVGIPRTLRETHSEITSDTDALDRAIREGITRDKSLGQGNGLYGSYQICNHSKGTFSVDSGHAMLELDSRGRLSIRNSNIPYSGTLVVAEIDFSRPGLLEEALKFGGKAHTPVDIIETNYESDSGNIVTFRMIDESQSFGSRAAGTPIRTKLTNIYRMSNERKVIVDFANVPLISSSFADEVFGKLFLEIGPVAFMSKFEFANAMDTIKQLIDRAITQRLAVSPDGT